MKKFECDRCGKVFNPHSDDLHLDLPIKTVKAGEYVNKGMDLCAECHRSLTAMLVHWVEDQEPTGWR